MATLIDKPVQIASAGNKPKIIREFIGRVSSKTERASVARMSSPEGWVETKAKTFSPDTVRRDPD